MTTADDCCVTGMQDAILEKLPVSRGQVYWREDRLDRGGMVGEAGTIFPCFFSFVLFLLSKCEGERCLRYSRESGVSRYHIIHL